MIPKTLEDAYALAAVPPLREIEFGGRKFAIGDLSDEQMATLNRVGTECARGIPNELTRDVFFILRQLLIAGDPDFDPREVGPHLRAEHVGIANKEFVRQAIVHVLSPKAMAGNA